MRTRIEIAASTRWDHHARLLRLAALHTRLKQTIVNLTSCDIYIGRMHQIGRPRSPGTTFTDHSVALALRFDLQRVFGVKKMLIPPRHDLLARAIAPFHVLAEE